MLPISLPRIRDDDGIIIDTVIAPPLSGCQAMWTLTLLPRKGERGLLRFQSQTRKKCTEAHEVVRVGALQHKQRMEMARLYLIVYITYSPRSTLP
jgi:hypothetical protein